MAETVISDITVDGSVTAPTFSGDGSGLTGLTPSVIASVNNLQNCAFTTNGFPILTGKSALNITANPMTITNITATKFSGNGSGLTNLPVSVVPFKTTTTIEGEIYYNNTTKRHYAFDGTNIHPLYTLF